MKNAHNLGKTIFFFLDEDKIQGKITAIHESRSIIESTPAWEKMETKYRYYVDVEDRDMGFVWVKHEDIIDNIN